MNPRTKTYEIPDTKDLQLYLQIATANIDGLSDEELDRAENDFQIEISSFLTQKNRSQSHLSLSSRFSKYYRKMSAPILMAAALIFVLMPKDKSEDFSIAKSFRSDSMVNCEVSVLQNERRIVLSADSSFVVNSLSKIYLLSNCKGDLTLQSLERGIWVDKAFGSLEKGIFVEDDAYFDLRGLLGREFRLKSTESTSEEVSLVTSLKS